MRIVTIGSDMTPVMTGQVEVVTGWLTNTTAFKVRSRDVHDAGVDDFSWGALPHNGAFATTDGALVVVGAFKDNPLRGISLAIGLPDLSADSQTEIKAMLVRSGTLRVVGSPVHLSNDGFALRLHPSAVGAQGADILAEHGYEPDEIAALRQDGVLA